MRATEAGPMDSIYLKTLIEVAKSGNITRASEVMNITQSAASRRIKYLEDQYGQPLLDRSGPALTLTPAGRVVLEQAHRILEIEHELASRLESLEGKERLSFVCTPTFGLAHLPELLRDFMRTRAEVCALEFKLEMPAEVVAGLKGGRYGLAVLEHCQCFDLSDFETTGLVGDQMVFASSPALGLGGAEVELEALLGATLFTRGEGCCSRHLLSSNLQAVGRRIEDFQRVVVFDDLLVILDALVRGEGVAFVSRDLVRPHVVAGRLREHRVPGFLHERQRTLVRAHGLDGQDTVAAFVGEVLRRHGQGRHLRPLSACS